MKLTAGLNNFLKTHMPRRFLWLVGLEKLTKGKKRGKRRRGRYQNESVAAAVKAGGAEAPEADPFCLSGRFGYCSCGDTHEGNFCFSFFRMLVVWQFVSFLSFFFFLM